MMSSAVNPADALSYQLNHQAVLLLDAGSAFISLKELPYTTRSDAKTGTLDETVTGPPMAPKPQLNNPTRPGSID
jgi:hypothetical protein